MAATAPGRTGRSEDSQCYNCGLTGHWTVACPEPTRQTPAGLVAWRSSSNTGPPNGRETHGNRRSSGPIITKYGPPPAPPVPLYSQPHVYPQPHAPYPGPTPSYPPHYPPYPPPGHHHPLAYPQPGYGPQQYFPPQYQGHTLTGPPGFGSIPPPTQGAYHQYPPLPGPPPHAPGYAHSTPYRHGHSAPSSYSYSHPVTPSYPPASAPSPHIPSPVSSTYMAPPTPQPLDKLTRSLPPKPPRANANRGEAHERKRKNDRGRHRDNRRKDHSSDRPPFTQTANQVSQHNAAQDGTSPDKTPQKQLFKQKNTAEQLQTQSPPESSSPKSVEILSEEAEQPADDKSEIVPFVADGAHEVDREIKDGAIHAELRKSSAPNDVGSSLKGACDEELSEPRKEDAACVEAEFSTAQETQELTKPLCETSDWSKNQGHSASVLDGHSSDGDPVSRRSSRKNSTPEKLDSQDTCDKNQRDKSSEVDNDERPTKRPKLTPRSRSVRRSSGGDSRERGPDFYQSLRESNHSQKGHRDRTPTPDSRPVSRGRQVSADRRGPRMERSSSTSSDSSYLSDLEAELLGRSPKKRWASDKERRRREESNRIQRLRRRRPETSSVYSRRW